MVIKKKELSDEEVDKIMNEDSKTNHSDHVRSKNYNRECYWCVNLGFIQDDIK